MLVTTAVALGCGGSGPDRDPGTVIDDGSTPVTLRADTAYNGNGSLFRSNELSGSSTATATTSAAIGRGRRFDLILPTAAFQTGQSFTIGVPGTSVIYSESSGRKWTATYGTVAVDVADANLIHVRLVGAIFTPMGSSGARGRFVATGPFVLSYGVDNGPGTLAFLGNGTVGTNAILDPIIEGSSHLSDLTGLSVFIGATARDGTARYLNLSLPAEAQAGTSGTFTDPSSDENRLEYSESQIKTRRAWIATGGEWRVVSRSRSNIEIALTNVQMSPNSTGASGSFLLSGTIRR